MKVEKIQGLEGGGSDIFFSMRHERAADDFGNVLNDTGKRLAETT